MPYLKGHRVFVPAADFTHAGLWLEKQLSMIEHSNEQYRVPNFLTATESNRDAPKERDAPKPKFALIDAVPSIAARVTEVYTAFYARWLEQIETFEGTELRSGQSLGRVLIGIGNESVLETNLCLHRTYGVPVLPGSALKGLCSSYAHQKLGVSWERPEVLGGKAGDNQRLLFGDTTFAGLVTFHDAMPTPENWSLEPDVITVHHQEYYNTKPENPPADWDSPIPNPLVSASGIWQFALTGAPQWVELAYTILGAALLELGIGAKTASGYGRIELEKSQAEKDLQVQATAAAKEAQGFVDALQSFTERISDRFISFKEIPQKIPKLAEELIQHPAQATQKLELAKAMLERIRKHPDAKDLLKKSSWSQELRTLAGEILS